MAGRSRGPFVEQTSTNPAGTVLGTIKDALGRVVSVVFAAAVAALHPVVLGWYKIRGIAKCVSQRRFKSLFPCRHIYLPGQAPRRLRETSPRGGRNRPG